MQDDIYSSLTVLATRLRNRDISSYELVHLCLERIDEVNGSLNAVVQFADGAKQQARAADDALIRGDVLGPLHGVPMTIKDSFDTTGVISTGGTTGRSDFVPEQDATVVKRVKEAGSILLGKTNTPELTLSYGTNNEVYGQTYNPYDLSRTPGGSSGGAAAIVASGGVPFDIGSDYGGSVRAPAHFCGVAGIKPTSGRVPRTGHIIPFASGAADSYQQIGPITRSVEDLELLLAVISGPDWKDPAVVPVPLLPVGDVDMSGLKVSFHTDNGVVTPTPDTIDTVRGVAKLLEGNVGSVEEARPPRLDETWEIWESLNRADGGGGFLEILNRAGTDLATSPVARGELGPDISANEFGRRIRAADLFRSDLLSFFAGYDVIICPVHSEPAFELGSPSDNIAGFSYTATYNVTGWPAAVVRAGTSPEGLPIGVQVIARPFREDVALAVALAVETSLGGWQPPSI